MSGDKKYDDDANLVLKMSEGDAEAFKELFMHYCPKLKFFINGLISNYAEAENIAQDIFVKLWLHREMLPDVGNINAYIYRIAKNAAYSYLRKAVVHQNYVEMHVGTQSEASDETLSDEIIVGEVRAQIARKVAAMPSRRRLIYTMSRDEGLSNDEIAQRLSISKRTVEDHISLALSDIRKVILSVPLFF